ncbi:MAG: DUF3592 domain-containing protein [Spirosomataceae bacterium]
MRRPEFYIGIIFTVVGLALLGGALYAYQSQKKFLSQAYASTGTVTALEYSRSRKGGGTYYPIVEFRTPDGQSYTFRSEMGSKPPAYDVGEQVEVRYNPKDPFDAKLTGFWSLWGLSVLFAGMGSVFSAIGISFLVYMIRRKRMIEQLKLSGSRIEFSPRVEYRSVKGRHQYYLRGQWLNPSDGKMYLFDSDTLAYDPTPFVQGRSVGVWVDPQNPKKKYYVDTSFLPEKA